MKISSILKFTGAVAAIFAAYKTGRYVGNGATLYGFCYVENVERGAASAVAQDTLNKTQPIVIAESMNDMEKFSDAMDIARLLAVGMLINEENGSFVNYLSNVRSCCNMIRSAYSNK